MDRRTHTLELGCRTLSGAVKPFRKGHGSSLTIMPLFLPVLGVGMRGLGTKENNIDRIQAWAGQSAALAAAEPASAIVERSWTGAQALLGLS